MTILFEGLPRSKGEPMFLWCHDTWRLPFETGIQRVVRRLGRCLAEHGFDIVPVGWDERTRRVKALGPRAIYGDQVLARALRSANRTSWLLMLELGMELAAADLDAAQIGHALGFKVAALVHDLIPLKFADDYDDDGFKLLFSRYLKMFVAADIVFTTTRYVAKDLIAYLSRDPGFSLSRIVTEPLPAQFAFNPRLRSAKSTPVSGGPLRLLTVSTWEPRKNIPRLLRAIRQAELRSASQIELTLVGQRGHFADYDAEVDGIAANMPRVTMRGSIGDEDLAKLYANSHASIYPSVEEGFGLPIGESLWLATPCICHSGSSMAEIAPGGGTLMVDMTDEVAITGALLKLVEDAELFARLSNEAVSRPLATWSEYARNIARTIFSMGPPRKLRPTGFGDQGARQPMWVDPDLILDTVT